MEDEDLIDFDEARPAGLLSLKLLAFWVDKPVSWFVLAESRFRLHGIHREQTRYDYLVSTLTKEAVSLVLDVVEHPPDRLPYSALKQSFLDLYQLSDYQKIAALHKMEPLSGRKPSELLASMLELCPRHLSPTYLPNIIHLWVFILDALAKKRRKKRQIFRSRAIGGRGEGRRKANLMNATSK
jgi:hypothetical protein